MNSNKPTCSFMVGDKDLKKNFSLSFWLEITLPLTQLNLVSIRTHRNNSKMLNFIEQYLE